MMLRHANTTGKTFKISIFATGRFLQHYCPRNYVVMLADKEFELTVIANQSNGEGKWYASNDVSFSEHTGTHLDAPIHFALRDGIWYSSTIPVDR